MRRGAISGLLLAAWALSASPGGADPAPANSLPDLYASLERCAGGAALAAGTDVTVVFMLNRRGGLIGKPRLTHAVWPKDADPRASAGQIAESLARCLPLTITDALGGAIAGRLISFRMRASPKAEKA